MPVNRRFSRAVAVSLTGVLVVAAAVVGTSMALSKVKCVPYAGRAQVDPIVAHGQGPSDHQHVFFGSTTLLGLSDPSSAGYTDLAGKGTNCADPGDTAAYWLPDLVTASGGSVPISSFRAYYRSWDHKDHGDGVAYPPDVRLVAGDPMNTKPLADLRHVNWGCDQASSRPGPYASIDQAACWRASGKVRLVAHITFPTCWDGKLAAHDVKGDTEDTAHFAYADRRGGCPAGYPNKTVELRETIWWDSDGSGVRLVTDAPGAPAGSSLHGDFWNTWNQSAFEQMVHDCITTKTRGGARCG